MSIEIRVLTELQDLYAAVELQTVYWGTEVESLVPAQMMFTIVKSGGHVVGAFDGARIIGVLIGLMAADGSPAADYLKIYSKRMVVLPEYRSQGIAQRLKLKQRELAMEQGINRITWTFDPLLSVNAHFNIRKLGVFCREYLVDYYGNAPDDAGLTIMGMSDRLVCSWVPTAPGVMARENDSYSPLAIMDYLDAGALIANPTHDRINVPPEVMDFDDNNQWVLLEIPTQFRGLVNAMPDVARAWQTHTRDLFRWLIQDEEYVVVDFLYTEYEDRERAFYVLDRDAIA